MLVASSALYLGDIQGTMKDFAAFLGSLFMGLLCVGMGLLFMMTASALVYRAALGGQRELVLLNLQKMPHPGALSGDLKSVACQICQMDHGLLEKATEALAVYDVKLLKATMALLATEMLSPDSVPRGLNSLRIGSSSFAASNNTAQQAQRRRSADTGPVAEPLKLPAARSSGMMAAPLEALPEDHDVPEKAMDPTSLVFI